MIRAAARRVSVFILLLGCVVVGVSAAAVLAGASFERAVSIGLYAVGSFTAVVGFALGTRSSFRSADRPGSGGSGDRSDVGEGTEASALFIVVGLVLLAVGIAVDPRVRLI